MIKYVSASKLYEHEKPIIPNKTENKTQWLTVTKTAYDYVHELYMKAVLV